MGYAAGRFLSSHGSFCPCGRASLANESLVESTQSGSKTLSWGSNAGGLGMLAARIKGILSQTVTACSGDSSDMRGWFRR